MRREGGFAPVAAYLEAECVGPDPHRAALVGSLSLSPSAVLRVGGGVPRGGVRRARPGPRGPGGLSPCLSLSRAPPPNPLVTSPLTAPRPPVAIPPPHLPSLRIGPRCCLRAAARCGAKAAARPDRMAAWRQACPAAATGALSPSVSPPSSCLYPPPPARPARQPCSPVEPHLLRPPAHCPTLRSARPPTAPPLRTESAAPAPFPGPPWPTRPGRARAGRAGAAGASGGGSPGPGPACRPAGTAQPLSPPASTGRAGRPGPGLSSADGSGPRRRSAGGWAGRKGAGGELCGRGGMGGWLRASLCMPPLVQEGYGLCGRGVWAARVPVHGPWPSNRGGHGATPDLTPPPPVSAGQGGYAILPMG